MHLLFSCCRLDPDHVTSAVTCSGFICPTSATEPESLCLRAFSGCWILLFTCQQQAKCVGEDVHISDSCPQKIASGKQDITAHLFCPSGGRTLRCALSSCPQLTSREWPWLTMASLTWSHTPFWLLPSPSSPLFYCCFLEIPTRWIVVLVVVVHLLSHVWLFVAPWTAAHQAPLSSTISWNLLKFMFIESVMLSNHLIFCHHFLLLSSIFPSIKLFFPMSQVFISGGQSTEASASAAVFPMNIQGWFSSGLTGLISLWSKELPRVFSSTTYQKHLFFGAQPLLYGPALTSIYDYWINHAAAAAKSLQSCPTLCDPKDGSPPGSPIPGILQARTLEWVAISFSSAWKWKVKVKSCPTLSDPMDYSLPGSSVHGIFQARVLEWGAIAFSVDKP